jgi:membrane-associated protease RseP (regulator of RpoE activity)
MLAAAVVSGVVSLSVLGQAPATPVAPPPPGAAPAALPPPEPAPALQARSVKTIGGLEDVRATPPAVKKEKQTFLGVNTSPIAGRGFEHLKLPRGVGIVMDAVDPGGPAEQAGIRPGDVLEKLDDQLLVNVEQFTALVRAGKPGDEVTITIHRDGKPQAIKAKLGQKEVTKRETGPTGILDVDPGLWAPVAPTPADPNALLQLTRPRKAQAAGGAFFMRDGVGRQQSEWADDQHRITIEKENGQTVSMVIREHKTGKKLLEARPPEPKVLEEIFKTMPELREKLKQAEGALNKTPNVKFQFMDVPQPVGAPPPPMVAPPALDVFVQAGPVGAGQGWVVGGNRRGGPGKVSTWQDDEQLLVLRFVGNAPTYLLALSKKDGRTIYDGPVMTQEQRSGLPAEVSEQFNMLAGKPEMAKEFGAPAAGAKGDKPQEKKEQPK